MRMHGRRVGLEVTELPVLLGIQPPLTTSPLWRLVKAAVLDQVAAAEGAIRSGVNLAEQLHADR